MASAASSAAAASSAGLKLDVTKVVRTSAHGATDNQIALLLELPDGQTDLRQYRPDLTVGFVKVEIAKAHGIPFECQELELAGKPMMDPLSLSDFPALKMSRAADPVRVVVKRVVPSDGEGDDSDLLADDAGGAGGANDPTSDYEDESFED